MKCTFGDVMVCRGVQRIYISVYLLCKGYFGVVCTRLIVNGTCSNGSVSWRYVPRVICVVVVWSGTGILFSIV